MIKIVQKKHIEYSVGDTFSLPVYQAYEGYFSESARLVFIVSENEQASFLIEKTFYPNEDLSFTVTLTQNECNKLVLGDYIYKIRILRDGKILTEKSGDFIVKWGA